MRLNKLVGFGLAIVLGLGVVGCGDAEVKENGTEQVQQQEVVEEEPQQVVDPQEVERHEEDGDVNLNKEARTGEYQFEERKSNETEEAFNIIEQAMVSSGLNEYEHKLYIKNDTIVLIIYLPSTTLNNVDLGSWNNLVESYNGFSSSLVGYYNTPFIVSLADYEENFWLISVDGEVMLDVVNGVNKLD